jgi:DNA-binding transcriptional MocR family regulator
MPPYVRDDRHDIRGSSSSAIAASIEGGIAAGTLAPGSTLPTVRTLARRLGVAPATVAAAYRSLRDRGLVLSAGRRGTMVRMRSQLTPSSRRTAPPVASGVRNLADGNPDRALLPSLERPLARIPTAHHLYGEGGNLPVLVDWAREDFERDGICAEHVTVVGGALDGIWRVLESHLWPGQRVAVEDPGHCGLLDLLSLLSLPPEPVPIDAEGMLPHALAAALERRVAAVVLTPRLQSPTGSAVGPARAAQLRTLLDRFPHVLAIEDDHSALIADVPMASVLPRSPVVHWAVVRSMAKALGPDLRVATLAGDAATIGRVEGRMQSSMGWVSFVLQHLAIDLLLDPATARVLEVARQTYAARRSALLAELARRGLPLTARSGFNVWLPVPAESLMVHELLARGWAVRSGEAFRLKTTPGVRITAATLEPDDAVALADDLVAALYQSRPASP